MTRPHWLLIGLLSFLSAAACTPAPNILPTNDLNRPTDIAFMCLGAFGTPGTDADGNPTETGPFTVSGRPMKTCHRPPIDDARAPDQPAASIHNRTFAFVPNSASGDLSVIDGDTWKLVDMDKSTSGYGRVPLGALPEQISSTTDGCRLVTANRGSCDLDDGRSVGAPREHVRRAVQHCRRFDPVGQRPATHPTPVQRHGVEPCALRGGVPAPQHGGAGGQHEPLSEQRRRADRAVARARHVPVVRSRGAGRFAVG